MKTPIEAINAELEKHIGIVSYSIYTHAALLALKAAIAPHLAALTPQPADADAAARALDATHYKQFAHCGDREREARRKKANKIAEAGYPQLVAERDAALARINELEAKLQSEFQSGVVQGHKEANQMEDETAAMDFLFGKLKREDLSLKQLAIAEATTPPIPSGWQLDGDHYTRQGDGVWTCPKSEDLQIFNKATGGKWIKSSKTPSVEEVAKVLMEAAGVSGECKDFHDEARAVVNLFAGTSNDPAARTELAAAQKELSETKEILEFNERIHDDHVTAVCDRAEKAEQQATVAAQERDASHARHRKLIESSNELSNALKAVAKQRDELKQKLVEAERVIEANTWSYSPGMAESKINQITQERDEARRQRDKFSNEVERFGTEMIKANALIISIRTELSDSRTNAECYFERMNAAENKLAATQPPAPVLVPATASMIRDHGAATVRYRDGSKPDDVFMSTTTKDGRAMVSVQEGCVYWHKESGEGASSEADLLMEQQQKTTRTLKLLVNTMPDKDGYYGCSYAHADESRLKPSRLDVCASIEIPLEDTSK